MVRTFAKISERIYNLLHISLHTNCELFFYPVNKTALCLYEGYKQISKIRSDAEILVKFQRTSSSAVPRTQEVWEILSKEPL